MVRKHVHCPSAKATRPSRLYIELMTIADSVFATWFCSQWGSEELRMPSASLTALCFSCGKTYSPRLAIGCGEA